MKKQETNKYSEDNVLSRIKHKEAELSNQIDNAVCILWLTFLPPEKSVTNEIKLHTSYFKKDDSKYKSNLRQEFLSETFSDLELLLTLLNPRLDQTCPSFLSRDY